ncbi:hypothetical protein EYC80_003447 [Monilinia laxa]|uniref:Uncharacterized protein n=1 Tax=Monilinia laxa TaxID=61186 RepID=A0A5N6KDU5_MONLA|nr:hypothetical protein EYC80_003447 [Monilinia laxa]
MNSLRPSFLTIRASNHRIHSIVSYFVPIYLLCLNRRIHNIVSYFFPIYLLCLSSSLPFFPTFILNRFI